MTSALTNPKIYDSDVPETVAKTKDAESKKVTHKLQRKSRLPKANAEIASDSKHINFVKLLTNADREWQAEINQTVTSFKSLRQCEDFLIKLETATSDDGVDLFDRGLGVGHWAACR